MTVVALKPPSAGPPNYNKYKSSSQGYASFLKRERPAVNEILINPVFTVLDWLDDLSERLDTLVPSKDRMDHWLICKIQDITARTRSQLLCVCEKARIRACGPRMPYTARMVTCVVHLKKRLENFICVLTRKVRDRHPKLYAAVFDQDGAWSTAYTLLALSQQSDLRRFASAGPSRLVPTETHASASSDAQTSVVKDGNATDTRVAFCTDIPGNVDNMCT